MEEIVDAQGVEERSVHARYDEQEQEWVPGQEMILVPYGIWSSVQKSWFYGASGELFYSPDLGIARAQLLCIHRIEDVSEQQMLANHQRQIVQATQQAAQRGQVVIPNLRGDNKGMMINQPVSLPPKPKYQRGKWEVAIIGGDGRPAPLLDEEAN